jgi:hypothetical protein
VRLYGVFRVRVAEEAEFTLELFFFVVRFRTGIASGAPPMVYTRSIMPRLTLAVFWPFHLRICSGFTLNWSAIPKAAKKPAKQAASKVKPKKALKKKAAKPKKKSAPKKAAKKKKKR